MNLFVNFIEKIDESIGHILCVSGKTGIISGDHLLDRDTMECPLSKEVTDFGGPPSSLKIRHIPLQAHNPVSRSELFSVSMSYLRTIRHIRL